jgi:hypothetical protein
MAVSPAEITLILLTAVHVGIGVMDYLEVRRARIEILLLFCSYLLLYLEIALIYN